MKICHPFSPAHFQADHTLCWILSVANASRLCKPDARATSCRVAGPAPQRGRLSRLPQVAISAHGPPLQLLLSGFKKRGGRK